MKEKTLDKILLVCACIIGLILLFGWQSTRADDDCRQAHDQCGHNDDGEGDVEAQAESEANAQADASSESNASAESSGGDASVVFGKRAPTNFLYMQNQVEACGRTFGFSGSNTSGGWAFGIPIPRSWTPTCDLWKAAEEAQQNGFVFTSYLFQCSIKAVRKVLGDETCNAFEQKALIELDLIVEDLTGGIWLPNDEYEALLMADVDAVEYQEQQQMVADKFAQYDNLIEDRLQKSLKDDAEIERLKREAAEAAKREHKEVARRAAAREALKKDDDDGK